MCCPPFDDAIRISVRSDNDCKCNCASSCCFPFFKKKQTQIIEEKVNEVASEILNDTQIIVHRHKKKKLPPTQ